MKYLEDGTVYEYLEFGAAKIVQALGGIEKKETIRIDNETVSDVFYEFDTNSNEYIETSRTVRSETLVIPPTTEEKISLLEAQNAELNLQIIDLFEQLLDKGVL